MTDTYQMLWDCPNCGTAKLLGLDHRHCPNCGSPQDPKWRYFPPDDQKIAVENHVFHGADKLCRNCDTANAKAATFCGGCGAPLDDAKGAVVRSDQVVADGQRFAADSAKSAKQDFTTQKQAAKAPPPPKPKSKGLRIFLVVLALLLVAIVVSVMWKREAAIRVVGHQWSRSIAIERFQPMPESEWCDHTPFDAYQITRKREVRDHKKIQDGEECSTRRKDQGDGTFKEARECKPKYRDEPIYGDKCYFMMNRWAHARDVQASGASLQPPPNWPTVQLAREGQCLGCEREGARKQRYQVLFKDDKDVKDYDCEFDEPKWAGLAMGTKLKAQVRVVTGGLDCGALQAMP